MSNPEPHGFPQGDQQSGANWPFLRSEQAQPVGQPVGSQPQPAFPAPSAPKAQEVPQYSQQFPQAASPVQPVQGQIAPLSEEATVPQTTSENPLPASVNEDAVPAKTVTENVSAKNDSRVSAAEIQQSLRQQALTPWWLDALMALSLAGVMVFNGFGMSMWLRIGSLIAMVIALILVTWYQGDAQEKSNAFLTSTLLGAVCGFLAGLIVVAASLYLVSPIPSWYPWALWLVSAVLLYLTYRGFRDWVMRNLQKKHRK